MLFSLSTPPNLSKKVCLSDGISPAVDAKSVSMQAKMLFRASA